MLAGLNPVGAVAMTGAAGSGKKGLPRTPAYRYSPAMFPCRRA